MKKGHSKNRHFSKGKTSKKNSKVCKYKAYTSSKEQLAEKNFKWSRIGTLIQLVDFLFDKMPRLCNWLVNLLGMG